MNTLPFEEIALRFAIALTEKYPLSELYSLGVSVIMKNASEMALAFREEMDRV